MRKWSMLLGIFCLVGLLAGCGGRNTGAQQALAEQDLGDITKIVLTNCHNGQRTVLTDPEALAEIVEFLQRVEGEKPESGRGYYEGSYSVALYRDEEPVLSLGFGDSDCYYMGDYGDGYPVRRQLVGMTIRGDVIPFFSRFDASGFSWE